MMTPTGHRSNYKKQMDTVREIFRIKAQVHILNLCLKYALSILLIYFFRSLSPASASAFLYLSA